ncbi:MAG: disulfide oxidoreductase, partial [Chloroflexaceae bacterium]|nr:disulfide oxidoreductase [Chloroflexaceae bacterium]
MRTHPGSEAMLDPAVAESEPFSERLLRLVHSASGYVALLAAWIATTGSLFLSEVLGWVPCVLCWYQRILMYPLALILGVGLLRRDKNMHVYVLPLSILGACTSLYHYLLIKTDWFPPPPCAAGVPCTVDYIDWFGFINIPFMALTAFLIITVMMLISTIQYEEVDDNATPVGIAQPAQRRSLASMPLIPVVVIVVGVVSSFVALAQF